MVLDFKVNGRLVVEMTINFFLYLHYFVPAFVAVTDRRDQIRKHVKKRVIYIKKRKLPHGK